VKEKECGFQNKEMWHIVIAMKEVVDKQNRSGNLSFIVRKKYQQSDEHEDMSKARFLDVRD